MREAYPSAEYDPDLEQQVIVFIASKNSPSRALWRMSKADAMKVCLDPRTAGRNSSLHWTAHGVDEPIEYTPDNGMYDHVLAEHEVEITAWNRPLEQT